MEVPTQELHRRPTLSHFMSRVESSNLRDLLKVRQDDAEAAAAAAARRRGAEATRTLATILACEKRDLSSDPSSSSSSVSSVTRTLLDIIRDEPEPNNRMLLPNGVVAAGSEGIGGPGANRGGVVVNWKALRDRLRLRRANEVLHASAAFGEGSQHRQGEEERGSSLQAVSGPGGPRPLLSIPESAPAAPADSTPVPDRAAAAATTITAGTTGDDTGASTSRPRSQEGQPPISNPPAAASSNNLPQPPSARHPRQQQQPRQRPPQPDEPTRVSLMALLEQADRTGGAVGGPPFAAAVVGLVEDGHGEEGHDPRTAGGAGGGDESLCCVCMVRNKGAAFIPCGHTFCRLCTRELWVSRGTCPLCNGFILEILDIF